jgi:DNA-nicking Smr family endonuclease
MLRFDLQEEEQQKHQQEQEEQKEFITIVEKRNKQKQKQKQKQTQKRVEKIREEMNTKYCSALKYFNHSRNHFLGMEKIHELKLLRQQLRQAQREKAHAFFEANQIHLHRHQPVELHGLIVMEALYVVKQCLLFCQEKKITKCQVICGMGNHSIDGKPRLLQAIEIFFTRKCIVFRKDHGLIAFYPFRNKQYTTKQIDTQTTNLPI